MDIFKSYKLKNDDVPVWAAEPFRSTILLTDKQFDIKDLKANLEKDWNILITDEVVDEKIIRFIYNDYVITIEHHLDNLD